MSTIVYESELCHHGIKGQKWGIRRKHDVSGSLGSHSSKMSISTTDSSVTKRVKKDYNNLSDQDFARKYSASKKTYAKRVSKYGDPYMNAPLAKIGKALKKHQDKTYNKNYSNYQRTKDTFVVGSIGAKHINKAMNKGKTHSQAFKVEVGKQVVLGTLAGLAITMANDPAARARVQQVGRAATETVLKAMGHTDITWK